MKLLISLGVLLWGYSTLGFCQQRMPAMSLDKIRAEIERVQNPQDKLRKYVELGSRYLRNKPDSLIAIAEDINELQAITKDQKVAFSSLLKANAWRMLNPDSTIYYAEKASELLRKLNEHDPYLSMENLKASEYQRQNSYLEAESLYLNAISYREELTGEIDFPIQFLYGNLGNLYVRVGAHDLAIDMFEKFMEYEDNPGARCNILSKLGTSFTALEQYDKAIETLSPCLEIDNLPPPIKAITYTNLSEMYKLTGDTLQALELLENGVEISTTNRIPNLANSQLVRLGKLYLDMDKTEKAYEVASKVENPVLPYSRPNDQIIKYEFLSDIELSKQNYVASIDYADQAIKVASEHNMLPMLQQVYSIKSEALAGLGRMDEALAAERKQKMLNEERFQSERVKRRSMMSVRYQLQNKEDALTSANLEIQNIRLRNMAIIICMILTAGYILYRYRVYYLLKEERTRNQIARDLHDDLSGTLSSISFFSEAALRVRKDPDEAQRFLEVITKSAVEAKEKINDIIWAIDPSKDDWSVFLKKCKRFAADVFDSNDIEYTIEIDETFSFPVQLKVRQNLWLIFKECVTNLSKHSNATEVKIRLTETNNKVHLMITDNGVGFEPDKINNGYGIRNIKYRAEQIDGVAELKTAPKEGTTWSFEFEAK
jgi:signal transduction histidine kinase